MLQTARQPRLQQGATSSVRLLAFTTPARQTVTYVVKSFPDNQKTIHDFDGTRIAFGIQLRPPSTVKDFAKDIGSRNLVAFSFAKKMRDLSGTPAQSLPIVECAAVEDPLNPNGPLQLFMEKARGKSANDLQAADLRACTKSQLAELARMVTWLQIEDSTIQQKDRHDKNLLIDFSGRGCIVKGIDNDACLDTQDSQIYQNEDYDKTRKEFPPRIDEPMANAIERMTNADLRNIFLESGRDPQSSPFLEEYIRCCQRLERYKSYVQYCRSHGRILHGPNPWMNQQAFNEFTEDNSYLAYYFNSKLHPGNLGTLFYHARD
jgi:hypothetical protein